ncbi:tetratricopeptide repeat protein [Xanthobacter dioxanivorans]|uniref:protein O-GlcNAc transferase n=1 Tax=Xanthobacter dioxanivorans TaxID=2528964 RepID=A0A974SJQ6_9HYPH|nr:tetratricopeptide repeat protein [Xanthobacter dioxanivorans]QRG08696.1 tetratricopeptide repeat protein [Xanthobacter dioxanivorans]
MPPAPPKGTAAPLPAHLATLLYDAYQHQLRAQYPQAARAYRKILQATPDNADVLQLLGIVRARQGREREAIALYLRALERRPDDAKAWYNLALAYGALGDQAQAVTAMTEAFVRDPHLPLAANVLIPAFRERWDWRGHAALWANARRGAVGESAPVMPFLMLHVDDPGLQFAAARRFVAADRPAVPKRDFDHTARRMATGPIRLAYLSADFRTHATTHLITQLFARHDRTRFEVTAISIGPDDGSPQRAGIVGAVDRFLDREKASCEAIAEEVSALGIDIFVDLMGHSRGERMRTFANRPAPVQVNYLGYPGTSGAPFFDYIIGDPVVLPFSLAGCFSEKIVQLPECYQPNDPGLPVSAAADRAACGLPPEAFVFCCFNVPEKLDPDTFSAFARIVSAVPGSVLWILEGLAGRRENLQREAAARGLDPSRLVFAPIVAPQAHLARVGLADLFLDTFPYTAHTTCSDALRRGVPVVTRSGAAFASRVAGSLLRQVDLADLVTTDVTAFEAKAIGLARDRAALAAVRARLQRALPHSPLYDIGRYTRHMERAYEIMAQRFRAGLPPEAFAVEPLPRA